MKKFFVRLLLAGATFLVMLLTLTLIGALYLAKLSVRIFLLFRARRHPEREIIVRGKVL